MDEKEENPGYVTKSFCDERFNRIMDKLEDLIESRKQSTQNWKSLALALISGATISLFTWWLSYH